MSKSIFVLVTGATGQQGGTLARVLLKKGHCVRGLTRKPDSPTAKELVRLGAEIATGGFDDRDALIRAQSSRNLMPCGPPPGGCYPHPVFCVNRIVADNPEYG